MAFRFDVAPACTVDLAVRNETGQDRLPEITVRVPGPWNRPEELIRALPAGYELAPDTLVMPGGGHLALWAQPPDREFPRIFAYACRGARTPRERRILENYRVNVCLVGPGGSVEAARRMLAGAAAVVRAGGAGVFVDNCAQAHSTCDWLELADEAEQDSALAAFVGVFKDKHELWSIGMHVMGRRDAVVPHHANGEVESGMLSDFLIYTLVADVVIADGDLVGDPSGPRYRLRKTPATRFQAGSPLHNPYGQWRLEPIARIGTDE